MLPADDQLNLDKIMKNMNSDSINNLQSKNQFLNKNNKIIL